MNSKRYPTDTTDAQWAIIRALLPRRRGPGAPTKVNLRRIVDGIFYISRSGCQWRMLPREFGPWETVYYYLRKWKKDGTLAAIHKKWLGADADPNTSTVMVIDLPKAQ